MDISNKFKGDKDFLPCLKQKYSEVYLSPRLKGYQPEVVKIDGCWVRCKFLVQDLELIKHIKEFEVRDDDVFIVGFPRSGNTLLNEIVYLIMNNADTAKAKGNVIDQRIPLLEFPVPGFEAVSKRPSPRLIKSHFPFQLIPEQTYARPCKVLYVMRNPKDVCVSYYHFVQYFYTLDFQGTFEEFFTEFVEGKVAFGPYFEHVTSFWKNKDKFKHLLFVKYEDILKDKKGIIKQIAKFLSKELDADDVNTIIEHCKFKNMKHNNATNFTHLEKQKLVKPSPENGERIGFIRNGIVGDWRNYFTPEMTRQFNQLVEEKWESYGIKFCDETNTWNF